MWKEEFASVEIVGAARQVVHCVVRRQGWPPWLLSCVYASPSREVRRELWGALEELGPFIQFPWLVLGDMNDIMCMEDKSGGNPPNLDRCLA
ncbi:MAG: hypothetical protein Q8807_03080, partial ['Waltheria sp.' little leaf phytoplasma]|nr:hypothetical protein ['Waltheria sp.' little leaf phytoplasma]